MKRQLRDDGAMKRVKVVRDQDCCMLDDMMTDRN